MGEWETRKSKTRRDKTYFCWMIALIKFIEWELSSRGRLGHGMLLSLKVTSIQQRGRMPTLSLVSNSRDFKIQNLLIILIVCWST